MDENVKLIAGALEKVESTHRAHGRAIAELHQLMARAITEHGAALGLDEGVVAMAAAPKDPPPIDG